VFTPWEKRGGEGDALGDLFRKEEGDFYLWRRKKGMTRRVLVPPKRKSHLTSEWKRGSRSAPLPRRPERGFSQFSFFPR